MARAFGRGRSGWAWVVGAAGAAIVSVAGSPDNGGMVTAPAVPSSPTVASPSVATPVTAVGGSTAGLPLLDIPKPVAPLTILVADTVSFTDDVLPIFQARCAECHGGEDANGEIRIEVSLNLLEYDRVIMGSEFGTVVEPGDPDGSFLLDMIMDGTMPEQGDPVPEEEIAVIRAWIEAGAPNN